MPSSVLEVDDLALALPKSADRPFAVHNLSFAIAPGELLCIVGESGSGKSMTALATMKLLPRAIVPVAGSIRLSGNELLTLAEGEMRHLRGRKMGMIFQEPMTCLNPVMRVINQVSEIFEAHGALGGEEGVRRTFELFDEVGLPDPTKIAYSYPHELSGGQRQRVMIAMALALEPELLIADEPTTALDVTTQAQILRLINDLRRKRGTAVLFITHDFGVVADIADRVLVMKDGECVENNLASEVLNSSSNDYTRKLLAAVPSLTPPRRRDFSNEDLAITVENLSKTHRSRTIFGGGRVVMAADDVNLSIRRGETLGLVGESGSGKTTVGRCLMRLIEPDRGRVTVTGSLISDMSQSSFRRMRHRIQMVFQDPYSSLNPRHSTGRIIAEGPIAMGVPKKEALNEARRSLELVGLPAAAADRYPHEFSGGQRQRIGIARALALKPDVLIADEPVSALDVSMQAEIIVLLKHLQAEFGLAILFVTHDLRVAAQMCDRVAVMKRGKIVEVQTIHKLLSSPKHPYTKALLAAVPGQKQLARMGRQTESVVGSIG